MNWAQVHLLFNRVRRLDDGHDPRNRETVPASIEMLVRRIRMDLRPAGGVSCRDI